MPLRWVPHDSPWYPYFRKPPYVSTFSTFFNRSMAASLKKPNGGTSQEPGQWLPWQACRPGRRSWAGWHGWNCFRMAGIFVGLWFPKKNGGGVLIHFIPFHSHFIRWAFPLLGNKHDWGFPYIKNMGDTRSHHPLDGKLMNGEEHCGRMFSKNCPTYICKYDMIYPDDPRLLQYNVCQCSDYVWYNIVLYIVYNM